MKTYTANEVVEMVDGLNSVSTLNKWVNFIEKNCHYTFQKEMIPYQSFRGGQAVINHKESRVYTEVEVGKFKQVPLLIKEVGREQALRELFDTRFQFEKMSHYDLLERLEGYFENKLESQTAETQKIQRQFAKVQSEVDAFKKEIEQLNIEKGKSTSGWFRRKRLGS